MIAARLRAACEEVRRKNFPLADLIPLMQQAADALDALGRTNAGDETGGTVKRFGFDLSGEKPEIIPATNGAYVWYSDYVKLFKEHQ